MLQGRTRLYGVLQVVRLSAVIHGQQSAVRMGKIHAFYNVLVHELCMLDRSARHTQAVTHSVTA